MAFLQPWFMIPMQGAQPCQDTWVKQWYAWVGNATCKHLYGGVAFPCLV